MSLWPNFIYGDNNKQTIMNCRGARHLVIDPLNALHS
jgi:hypothetical protein